MTQSNAPGQMICPHCGQVFAITPQQWPQYEGRSITCTQCGQPFTAVSPAQPPAAPPPIPPVAAAYAGGPAGFPPPGAHPAGASPALGYSAFVPPRKGMSGWVIALIVIGPLVVVGGCLLSILLPALSSARQQGQRAKCYANLRIIGRACTMYANTDRNGEFPDSVKSLVNGSPGMLDPRNFVCPSSSDTPSTATGSQLAADIDSPGHNSYIYVGKGHHAGDAGNTVIAYEPLTNHDSKGMNVLYLDGQVVWINKAQADHLIQQLQSGKGK